MKSYLISIIIPVYKNYPMFYQNLEKNKKFFNHCELIIVNDYPKKNITQEIKKIFPQAIVINNQNNLGFSKSVNLGAKQAKSNLIFLLNSDVILIDNSFKDSINLFNQYQDLFAVVFAQIEKNQEIFGANYGYFKNGLIHHQKRSINNQDQPTKNFWAEGGASLIRKDIFIKLGMFDDLYSPFYWEDVDLSYQAWKSGYQIVFNPKAKVIHHHESTIGKYFDKKTVKKIAFRNQLIFFWKNVFDKKMIFEHFLNLPKFIFKPGFFDALIKLPLIIKKRNQLKKIFKKTDREILNLFNKYD